MNQTRPRPAGLERPGLFSLAQIQYLLKVEFGRSLRYGHPMLALIVAVDRLNELCERLGYDAKEAALRAAVELVQRETRPFDFLGRLPDDRLLLVVPHVRPERANMKRESSPPEAILFNGPGGVPGLVLTRKATRSMPLSFQSGSESFSSWVMKRAFSSFSGTSSVATALSSAAAAFLRAAVIFSASAT